MQLIGNPFFTLLSHAGFDTKPEFELHFYDNGIFKFKGKNNVAYIGEQTFTLSEEDERSVHDFIDQLKLLNAKYYLKSIQTEQYQLLFRKIDESRQPISIDAHDFQSLDLIDQILEKTLVKPLITGPLSLFMVMNRPGFRSKAIGLVTGLNANYAKKMFLAEYNSSADWNQYFVVNLGLQEAMEPLLPQIYFSYQSHSIRSSAPLLRLNVGPEIAKSNRRCFLFTSFGKRYNDQKGVYFLVIAESNDHAQLIMKTQYPHFQPKDLQMSDLKVSLNPSLDLFTHCIAISIH